MLLFTVLLSIVSSFNLTQVVTEPTCVSTNAATLIDLIFASCPLLVNYHSPLANSDHNGLQLVIHLNSTKTSDKSVPRNVWKYALAIADYDAISDSLDSTDWDLLLSGNVDACWENWKKHFMNIMHRFFPHSMIIPDESLPWINSTVVKAIRKRKSLYRLYRCTESQLNLVKYKQQRNTVVALLRSRKEEYLKTLNPSNVKEFWKSIKKLNSNNS